MISDPRSLLHQLRWKADQAVINDFGEHVWLKPLYVDGERIGITDCCFVTDPCSRHKVIQGIQNQAQNN